MLTGQNFTAKVEGDKLIITVDLKGQTTVSGSGKSDVIASSRGNKQVKDAGEGVYLGLNVYKKKS